MTETVKVWCDKEADYLEVLFDTREGYFRETENQAVMEKIDKDGNILGFSVLSVSSLSQALVRQPQETDGIARCSGRIIEHLAFPDGRI